jgi:hypothetical protein
MTITGLSTNQAEVLYFIADGAWSTNTSGNIANAITAVAGNVYEAVYTQSTTKWYINQIGYNPPTYWSSNGIALPTGSISPGCSAASVSPITATGITTASHINFGWAGDPSAVSGYGSTGGLTVRVSPGSGTVIVKVCNPNSSSITAGTQSINAWQSQ